MHCEGVHVAKLEARVWLVLLAGRREQAERALSAVGVYRLAVLVLASEVRTAHGQPRLARLLEERRRPLRVRDRMLPRLRKHAEIVAACAVPRLARTREQRRLPRVDRRRRVRARDRVARARERPDAHVATSCRGGSKLGDTDAVDERSRGAGRATRRRRGASGRTQREREGDSKPFGRQDHR